MSGIEKERAPVVDYGSDEYAEAVAIVGIAGRWPGAESVAEFWENLRQGVESVSFFSEEEVEGVTPETAADPAYVKAKGIIRDPEWFDAGFFDVAPQEAAVMDPQHRVFLECAWSALEDAGYDASRYDGRVGVFGGMSINTYMLMNLALNPDAVRAAGQFQALIGNANDHLTTRVAYKLDLRGPAVTVQTACSTSLVAVHMACQSLLSGESDMALAGGVAVTFPLRTGYLYQEGMIFSPDGHCRAFDAEARGTVNGNGAGVVVLKRLADALDDGDHVYAIVRGSAVNNDGASKVGYTAPSVASQAAVVTEALSMAGVPPETISYVEAHGSGTPMGDPIEVAALTRAYRTRTPERGFCALGSVKTNIGHLDAAAGVSGLVRATLALRHRQIPPTLHFREPNPRIDFDGSPFYVGAELADWPAGAAPRRAGVNSLGVGGTNAHAVLEEAPAPAPGGPSRPRQLLVLSAKTTTALEAATDRLATHLEAHPEQALADLAYTLQVGRREFRHRRVLMAGDREDAVRELRERGPQRLLTGDAGAGEGSGRPVVFMFPGLGEQYSGMARGLYAAEPAFAEEVDRCAELLRPHLGVDLRELLFPPEGAAAPSG
ncbi:MAG TPA: type I polyketide synthase, partial [Longimicrobiaceae bacterium]|nr:type I polyketide synthase [Longimicrobiaceae bacterium]